jgi:hypothetical protein
VAEFEVFAITKVARLEEDASKICKGGFANQAASRFRGIDGKGLLCMRSIGQAIAMVIEDAEWREEFAASVKLTIGAD